MQVLELYLFLKIIQDMWEKPAHAVFGSVISQDIRIHYCVQYVNIALQTFYSASLLLHKFCSLLQTHWALDAI